MKHLGLMAAGILLGINRAWCTTLLWNWFAAPVFGLPQLGIVNAYGLVLLAAMFTFHPKRDDLPQDTGKDIIHALSVFLGLLILTGYGWILKEFFR